jgi:hypothetical protein
MNMQKLWSKEQEKCHEQVVMLFKFGGATLSGAALSGLRRTCGFNLARGTTWKLSDSIE